MEDLLTIEALISLLTLTFLEVVLGIDNIIFISIVSDRLPEKNQKRARTIGLVLAIVMRILLLLSITWIVKLENPLFHLFGHGVSVRDLILMAGGLFLIAKSTSEIHSKVMGGEDEEALKSQGTLTVGKAILQIILLDMVFSFDSILTAIGLSDQIVIMVIAVLISLVIMLVFVEKINSFVNQYPTVKVLALSFLLMIGTLLVLDGFHIEVPKGYIYFSLVFSLFVEFLNLRMRKKRLEKD